MAALAFVTPDMVLGVGTGSTIAHFIRALGEYAGRPSRAVATSVDTEERLRRTGIATIPLEAADTPLALYVDGADEIDRDGGAIKGGGGAHTQEKRVARASTLWVCIVDEHKLVNRIGERAAVPLEIEADSFADVATAVTALGGTATLREPRRLADSGNPLADVRGLSLTDALSMERALEAIPGVIACGIFAQRRADVILVGRADGTVERIITAASNPTSISGSDSR